MKHRIAIIFTLALAAIIPHAFAGTCNLTEFTSSGTLTAERLNQRVRQTEACVNGGIGNTNWDTSDPLANANLSNPNALFATSWTILDEDGDATAGEDISTTFGANVRKWRVPVTSTIVGMSVALRCPSDVTGTAGDCAAASVTVTLQKDTTSIKAFSGVATNATQTDFTLNDSVTNAQDLNIDISGTTTDVDAIDIVIYAKAQHQT